MKANLEVRGSSFEPLNFETDSKEWGAVEIVDWLDEGYLDADIFRSERDPSQWLNIHRGDAHSIQVKGDLVFIECQYVFEQKVLLTKQQAQFALEERNRCDKIFSKDPSHQPEQFVIEYIAGGKEALQKYQELGGTQWEEVE